MNDKFVVVRDSCEPAHAYIAGQHYRDEVPPGLKLGSPLFYCPFKEPAMQLAWLSGFIGQPYEQLDLPSAIR